MARILISWMGFKNDFQQGEVNLNGPTYLFHKYFFRDYDKHVILFSSPEHDNRAGLLRTALKRDFPTHKVEMKLLEVRDVINLEEISPKVEKELLSHAEDKIDIFFSPGTSVMQVCWYLSHNNLRLDTRLLQTTAPGLAADDMPIISELKAISSPMPVAAVIRQQSLDRGKKPPAEDGFCETPSLRKVYEAGLKTAKADVTTIIYGDTGTGKEHLARYVWKNSARSGRTFVTVNCSAMGDHLLESRLFGYRKGSFTGADKDTKGLIEEADGGTIFLDEIGDISPYMQQSLLRFLQEGEIQPVGGRARKVDVRVVVATNRNLHQLCIDGKFRWDLFYRLNVAELNVPRLIERGRDEIAAMIDYFLDSKREMFRRPTRLILDRDVRQFLLNYTFPGNVRELEQVITSFYVYCEEIATMDRIPERMKSPPLSESLSWRDVEKQHIEKVLRLKNGNQRQACIALGYKSINTLRKKISDYDLQG
jgi:transcriptional regulator with PAS, ATPase and Fis domain